MADLPERPETVSVADTTLDQSQYDFNYLAFPADLGAEDQSHYMVININVPVHVDGSRRTGLNDGATFLGREYSKVDVLRFGSAFNSGAAAPQREAFAIPRFTRRIAQSIALFMPGSVIYSSQNAYEDISLTAIAGSIGTGVLAGVASRFGALGRAVGRTAQLAAGVVGQASRIAGYPINPRVEILFATTPQRQFVFEVLMAPRNRYEADSIYNIIRTLRYHAAPEIDSRVQGLTFIPPAEFDITFYHNGEENTAIPRINTCVLERIDVDVAPTGVYSTFLDGSPVATRLSMGFREVEIVHKLRVAQGF